MEKPFLISVIAFFTLLSLSAVAQEEQGLPPLRAPDKTRWVVTVENAAPQEVTDTDSRTRPPVLQQTVGEKDGDIYRILNRFTNGENQEFWILPQIQFQKTTGSNTVLRLAHGDSASYDLSESDFPELYWVAGEIPKTVKIEGKEFLLVEMEAAKKRPTRRQMTDEEQIRLLHKEAGLDLPSGVSTAKDEGLTTLRLFLDPQTKLPVRYEEGNSIRTYRFEPSRGVKDLIPPDFSSAIKSWHQRFMAIMRPPSEPRVRNRAQQ